jgi:hypothetical protein
VRQFERRNHDVVVVLLDRETQNQGPAEIAAALEREFARKAYGVPVRVVVKDRQFENWLVADLDALRQCRRFGLP